VRGRWTKRSGRIFGRLLEEANRFRLQEDDEHGGQTEGGGIECQVRKEEWNVSDGGDRSMGDGHVVE
jgi:hypothetical protein